MQIFDAEDKIAKALTDHMRERGDDLSFWLFVDNFANTVGFKIGSLEDKATVELIDHCAEHYEYLKRAHPSYFQSLNDPKGVQPAALAAVVDWALLKGIQPQHFAGPRSVTLTRIVESMRQVRKSDIVPSDESSDVATTSSADSERQSAIEALQARRAERGRADPFNRLTTHINNAIADGAEPVINKPARSPELDVSSAYDLPARFVRAKTVEEAAQAEPEAPRYSHDELAEFAKAHFERKVDTVIRVAEYGDTSGYYRGTRHCDASEQLYELAMVTATSEKDLLIGDFDAEGGLTIRGTWSLTMLSGPLEGHSCFAHGPTYYEDGTAASDDMMIVTHSTVDQIRHPNLSIDDLFDLQWAEVSELSGQQVYVKAVTGYVGETDHQETILLDPPALVTIDPINRARFKNDSQIRDFDHDNDVVDLDVDISSDDPRLEEYRALYCGAPSYYQSGRRDANDIVEAYDPTLDVDREPTAVSIR